MSSLSSVSCASPSACTAVGSHDDSSLGEVILAERWDGRRWAVQATPNPPNQFQRSLSGVSCASAAACIAVGSYGDGRFSDATLAERWDGRRWAIQATPNPSGVMARMSSVSCTSANACTAVGSAFGGGVSGVALVERWDGTRWAIQPTPNPTGATHSNLSGVSCTSASACTAVGSYSGAGEPSTLTERWDGRSWAVQPTPNPSGATGSNLSGVSCASVSVCIAVGAYHNGGGFDVTLAEQWDGTRWAIQPSPNPPGAVENTLSSVSCASASACTAVGYGSGGAVTLAERWDGTRWAIQPTHNPSGATGSNLSGVSCASVSVCIAVGANSNSVTALAERWDARPAVMPAGAKLTGIPAGCVRSRFTARIKGEGISSVRWFLDGRQIRGRVVHRGTWYAASIRPSPGRHQLTVRVNFDAASRTHTRTFHRTVFGCQSHAA